MLMVRNLDSSATVTITSTDLATTFETGDTLYFHDRQAHPDSIWQTVLDWDGGNVTLNMPGINSPAYQVPIISDDATKTFMQWDAGTWHTDRRIGGFEIMINGIAAAAEGEATPARNIILIQ
jgi:hypothetical protein